jgi:Na+-driven multidrug efflux pump
MLRLGAPIALQDLLVSISFLMILAIVNSMGVIASAGVGVAAAADYLKSYAIDCLFTAIFFCYVGYYNGIGKTSFVMLQGIAGALLVRVPVSYLMSRTKGATLFRIGLATPISSVLQLVLCLGYMCVLSSHDTFGENGNCRAESEDE